MRTNGPRQDLQQSDYDGRSHCFSIRKAKRKAACQSAGPCKFLAKLSTLGCLYYDPATLASVPLYAMQLSSVNKINDILAVAEQSFEGVNLFDDMDEFYCYAGIYSN